MEVSDNRIIGNRYFYSDSFGLVKIHVHCGGNDYPCHCPDCSCFPYCKAVRYIVRYIKGGGIKSGTRMDGLQRLACEVELFCARHLFMISALGGGISDLRGIVDDRGANGVKAVVP